MNADCRDLRPLLSAYMDNELTADELRAVQKHVATCADCAAVLREYRQVRSAMRSLAQPTPPAELRAAVFARATPAYRRRAAALTLGQRGISYAALAAATIAIVITAALLFRSGVGPGIAFTPDTTPPRVLSLTPAPGTNASGLNSPIKIAFSEPMDKPSVQAALSIEAKPPLSTADLALLLDSMKWDGDTLVIGEGLALNPDTDYTVTIDANRARDRSQNTLQAWNTYQFRTVDVVAAPPTAIIAIASPTAQPTATSPPTESPAVTPPMAAPTTTPSATARPSDAPIAPITPSPVIAVASAQPSASSAPVLPINTPAPTTAPPSPTATTAPPTATLSPTSTPTLAPTPTLTPTTAPPSPTATVPPPTPTVTPVRSPYTPGKSFAPIYEPLTERLGLPTANEASVAGAYQAFENGWMLWRGDTRTVYVLFNENPLVWYAFADGWVDGMEHGGGPADKPGLYKPQRGFGKVWNENPDVQRRLGFAITPSETGGTIAIQPFERGLMIASNLGSPTVFVFYQNNTFEQYPR